MNEVLVETVLCTLGFVIVKFTRDSCVERNHSNLGVDQNDSSCGDWERFVKSLIENF